MAIIDVSVPMGELPGVDPKLIPENASVRSENVNSESGSWAPFEDFEDLPVSLRSGTIKSLFLYEDEHWFSWNEFVNAIKSPVAQDQYRRIYYTGSTGAKVTSNLIATGSTVMPAASYDLGVPAPQSEISGSVNDSGGDPDNFSDDETRYYVMTYVTAYGEEGASGPVSLPIEIESPTDTVDLTLPVPGVNSSNISKKRIYRTSLGSDVEFLFVAEVDLAVTGFTDNISGESLGGVLETSGYLLPPNNAEGIVALSNGSVAMFAGNEIVVSEPYLPYAFPIDYRHSVEYDIIAIAPTRYGLAVLTEGKPYILSGGHPSAMGLEELDTNQSCVSASSVVDMGGAVIYASPDGLVAISEGGAKLITEGFLTKKSWSQFYPETIHAYRTEGKYFGFYGDVSGTGSGLAGFVFDVATASFSHLDFYASAGFSDVKNDALFLVVDGNLKKWRHGTGILPFLWRSKLFDMPETSFTCIRVDADTPADTSLTLMVDGQSVLSVPSLPDKVFKIPPVRGRQWQFEISGTSSISRVRLASSMSEL